jgi:hypothetical protein
VVRDDKVDVAVEKRLPQLFAVRVVADGRAALVERLAPCDLLGGQAKVVEAGFD